jgi:hypothetical protein
LLYPSELQARENILTAKRLYPRLYPKLYPSRVPQASFLRLGPSTQSLKAHLREVLIKRQRHFSAPRFLHLKASQSIRLQLLSAARF